MGEASDKLGMSAAAEIEWTTARDGSRTARVDGRWLAGCSVPRRAAEMMLRQLVVKGQVACLLLPTHAHQIAVCMETIDPATALIVLVDDQASLDLIHACHDFSAYDGRVFFAIDEASLRAIFRAHPGLPIPQQFIRTPVTPSDAADRAIIWAQRVFSDVLADHTQRAALARANWRPEDVESLCVIASRRFRLWNDAGDQLARAFCAADTINADLPTQISIAFIAERAQRAAAVVTADVGRADRPELISPRQPWISWITHPRVPAFVGTSPQDGLIVVDPSFAELAAQQGWPRGRVRVGGYPPISRLEPSSSPAAATLALIADLPDLTPPPDIQEYSSWRVVWDAIRKDLPDNPHRLAGDIDGYLDKARRHFGVPAEHFPQQTFVDRLVAPAYLIGIARWLVRESIPLAIHGHGWEMVDSVRPHVRGPITSRDQLDQALTNAAAIIDGTVGGFHPVRSIPLPRVSTFGRTPQRVVHDAKALLARQSHDLAAQSLTTPIDIALVRSLLS